MMIRFSQVRGARSMLLAAAAVAGIGSASAEDIKVKLSGAEETPAVETAASGTGSFSVSADKVLSGEVKTTGIEGTAAHIHSGAPGEKGPPVITLAKASDGAWAVPADSKLSDEQYAALKAGKLYVNVHSADHKPGEIRGQLKP
jgi:hypothetical protein